MAKPQKNDGALIKRFGKTAIFAHWAHTATYFLLAFSGMIIFVKAFGNAVGAFETVRLLHRVVAVGFIAFPIISLILNPKGFIEWMQDIFHWGANEVNFLKAFPNELMGKHVVFPPQTKFNAGEKINSMIQISFGLILAVTGLMLWFKGYFPASVLRYALMVHDVAFILTFCAVMGHAFMAAGLPSTSHGINGLISGYVKEDWARSQYLLWVEKVRREEAK